MAWYTALAVAFARQRADCSTGGRKGVTEPGSRNWMGMNSPAAEAMIAAMLDSTSQEDFIAATQALDRVLTAGRYVIPVWFSNVVAHRAFEASSLPRADSAIRGLAGLSARSLVV